jgi:hypothetical protein
MLLLEASQRDLWEQDGVWADSKKLEFPLTGRPACPCPQGYFRASVGRTPMPGHSPCSEEADIGRKLQAQTGPERRFSALWTNLQAL